MHTNDKHVKIVCKLMKLIFYIIVSITNLNFFTLYSQYETNATYGLKLGILNSSINNLPETIKGRDNTLSNSTITPKSIYGLEGGFFANFKLYDSRVAIQPEVLFRLAGSKVTYWDATNKTYELQLNYSYIQLGSLYKIYPYEGINLGIGVFYGINLSPNNVSYTSNVNDGQYDVATRQFYKDGLSGKGDFSLCFNLGYELHKSVHFDLRYYYGVNDAVKSYSNSFQFIENQNKSNVFSFCVGYSLHQW